MFGCVFRLIPKNIQACSTIFKDYLNNFRNLLSLIHFLVMSNFFFCRHLGIKIRMTIWANRYGYPFLIATLTQNVIFTTWPVNFLSIPVLVYMYPKYPHPLSNRVYISWLYPLCIIFTLYTLDTIAILANFHFHFNPNHEILIR